MWSSEDEAGILLILKGNFVRHPRCGLPLLSIAEWQGLTDWRYNNTYWFYIITEDSFQKTELMFHVIVSLWLTFHKSVESGS